MTTPEEAIQQFLVNPLHSGFLVPEAQSATHRDALTQAGFKTSWHTALSGKFHFRALRVTLGGRRGPQRLARLTTALEILFGTTEDLATLEGRIHDQILPIIAPSEVGVVIDRPKNEDTKAEKKEIAGIAAYLPLLTRLCLISGLKLTFHSSRERIIPPRTDDGRIHIYPNACPPGESGTWYVDTAFGLEIAAGSKDRPVGYGPTEGRGLVLKDKDEKSLVQILGNTWYLLIPTLSYFNSLTSAVIFEELLAMAWHAVSTKSQPKKSLSPSRFLKETRSWTEGYTQYLDDQIKQMEAEIERLLKKMAELHRDLAMFRDIKQGVKAAAFSRQTRRRLPGELKKIQEHPLVEGIELFKDAIHIRTVPLTTSHEEVEYLTGAFTIRINRRGAVTVWSEGPTHPDGVPHPHIAKHGGPCYGNAGTAIAKAGGEARYADAVHYVLVWLTQGYTHDLASVKIHEWPIATQGGSDATRS